jgi:hypothetical protein
MVDASIYAEVYGLLLVQARMESNLNCPFPFRRISEGSFQGVCFNKPYRCIRAAAMLPRYVFVGGFWMGLLLQNQRCICRHCSRLASLHPQNTFDLRFCFYAIFDWIKGSTVTCFPDFYIGTQSAFRTVGHTVDSFDRHRLGCQFLKH